MATTSTARGLVGRVKDALPISRSTSVACGSHLTNEKILVLQRRPARFALSVPTPRMVTRYSPHPGHPPPPPTAVMLEPCEAVL